MTFENLTLWAEEELKSLLNVLPEDIQAASKLCCVAFEEFPDDSLEPDDLGCFEGKTHDEEADPSQPPRIRLFLRSIWDLADEDEDNYRDEVGTTFLHELGHYLGWGEDDIASHGLA